MIVCICNNLPTKEIQEAIEMHPSVGVFEIHDVMNCNLGCGSCIPEINQMIEITRAKECST